VVTLAEKDLCFHNLLSHQLKAHSVPSSCRFDFMKRRVTLCGRLEGSFLVRSKLVLVPCRDTENAPTETSSLRQPRPWVSEQAHLLDWHADSLQWSSGGRGCSGWKSPGFSHSRGCNKTGIIFQMGMLHGYC
jgi:hypothetical protein